MKFKFVRSWKHRYAGININNMSYYFCWRDAEVSRWGYLEDYYDGPFASFHLDVLPIYGIMINRIKNERYISIRRD